MVSRRSRDVAEEPGGCRHRCQMTVVLHVLALYWLERVIRTTHQSSGFISSLAHCSRLSVRRPLYLERSTWSVPFSMTAPMSDAASGVSLYLVRGEGWRWGEGTQPRGTGWRSVSVCRGAPRPQRCLGQSVTGASRGPLLVKLRDYPEKHLINRIPIHPIIAIYVIGTDTIQSSSGSLATKQR